MIPCPTCRVDDAAAHHEGETVTCPECRGRARYYKHGERSEACARCGGKGTIPKTHSFRPEAITDDEADLIRRMTPEEQAYLCGRLVEREGPDTPEDRAALFEQMRMIVNERWHGSPYSVSEIRAFVARWKKVASPSPREPYLLHAADWLCRQVEDLRIQVTDLGTHLDASRHELPDDPPEGYTLPEAIRALRNRIGLLENALRFYADNRNYETLASTGHTRIDTDFGLIARDALLNPKARK